MKHDFITQSWVNHLIGKRNYQLHEKVDKILGYSGTSIQMRYLKKSTSAMISRSNYQAKLSKKKKLSNSAQGIQTVFRWYFSISVRTPEKGAAERTFSTKEKRHDPKTAVEFFKYPSV